ncbi:MAG TPA: hypothetical protein VNK03_06660 [Gammaproteobacteria bacterium]|nr:hypothetical protein [Gammaproteobacteria bacterium]
MYFINRYQKNKAEEAFRRALDLQKEALHPLAPEQVSVELYSQAYEAYKRIADNTLVANQMRGKAGYNMYLLAKENKAVLSLAANKGAACETPEEKLEKLLIWSVNFGCSEAISEITDVRPTFSPLRLARKPKTSDANV